MSKDIRKICRVGLDVGSVLAKMVVIVPDKISCQLKDVVIHKKIQDGSVIAFKPVTVLGNPMLAAVKLLEKLFKAVASDYPIYLYCTGSNGTLLTHVLSIPHMNEFMAISRGVIKIVPQAKTILEIGGDGSKFIKISSDSCNEFVLQDYQRNGECAAGTGSFIDQQAARMQYKIEEIGPLVLQAGKAASIAGRCSVFAKTDMIHAQQRGYSPGAIFKGLCEAVVRNYKGTVLRGKELEPTVVFIGGLAQNSGVVDAMRSVLALNSSQLIVPALHLYAGAIGCIASNNGYEIHPGIINTLKQKSDDKHIAFSGSVQLKDARTRIVKNVTLKSNHSLRGQPIPVCIGIDIGSVSTNLVMLDQKGYVIDEVYTRTEGRPIEVVQRELLGWDKKWGAKVRVIGAGTTGSGRELIGKLIGADVIHDEITAHKTGAGFVAKTLFDEDVDTIFEIGGQDSKFISIENGVVVDFNMNEACAAGTGSFLEEQAAKLGICIEKDFSRLAMRSKNPVRMGERCTVFMEKDVTGYLQQGVPINDIVAGLAFAVAQNYLNRVVRGRKIGESIYFQGGTAYNKAVAAAFATILNKKITVPPHNGVIGALGVALLAKTKMHSETGPSGFRGFDLTKINYRIRQFTCKACSNHCDIQECTVENEKSYWGDKCSERYRQRQKVAHRAAIPNLVHSYQQLLLQDLPGPNGFQFKVGIPRCLYFYERFPFWRAYFTELSVEIVLSESTNRRLIAKAQETCIAEPCFPILVSHGHLVDLFEQKLDYIFTPLMINSETNFPEQESWLCPWGQTLALVFKNTFYRSAYADRILSPVLRFRDGVDSVKKSLRPVAKLFGGSEKQSDKAVDIAFMVYHRFCEELKRIGIETLRKLQDAHEQGIVIIGRPYNIYDNGLNLNVPNLLYEEYGVNVVPLDFLPCENIDVTSVHENMFWNYGRRILQSGLFVGQQKNLHVIYFTNFKCGPDSYIKHFMRDAIGAPYLILQFDDHSNDAGITTRCEAYLQSKNLLKKKTRPLSRRNVVLDRE